MKKFIVAIIGLCFITSVHSQVDFDSEFAKIVEADRKVATLIREFRSTLNENQIAMLLSNDIKASSIVKEYNISESKLKELKETSETAHDLSVGLAIKLYGSLSKINVKELSDRIMNYLKTHLANPAECLGCIGACYSFYYDCLNQGGSNCVQARDICISFCYILPGAPCHMD